MTGRLMSFGLYSERAIYEVKGKMGVRYVDKECEYCGKRMVMVSSRRKYCDSCQEKVKNESCKVHYKTRKNAPKPVRDIRDITQCRTCKYSEYLGGGNNIICNYIEVMGHMRGCEPSPNCTKYEKGKRTSIKLRRRGL